MENKKILVVDDEPDFTFLCKMILEDEGFAVDEYTNPFYLFLILSQIFMICSFLT
ncbi:MAG: hypothetical protein H0X50_09690 [Nitrosopumilus sp.]|nr:hypothetical protein [Nitrosopumilus sp.]